MIKTNQFNHSQYHIGAEQELCLVDAYSNVSKNNLAILKKLNSPYFTTELAKFNLEINLEPILFHPSCLSAMEQDLLNHLDTLKTVTNELDTRSYLGGILPTLRYMDLDLDNITPTKRYFELVKNINSFRGEDYELRIQGEDELLMRHDSVFIEAATTSFQIHLELPPNEFAKFYNIAQLIAAPTLAVAANSSLLFRKKLWHETRIALLRQSIDIMKTSNTMRDSFSRVTFGNKWVNDSILELFKEDVSLHRVLILPEMIEDSRNVFNLNKTPELKALQLYNSTIYRWNRPVYGFREGKPHLRIENRILPSGPTIVDQIANAAFWYGLMFGIKDLNLDFEKTMNFSTAKNNFTQAARNGLNSRFDWIDGENYSAIDLITKTLLPIAYKGLKKMNIQEIDIQKYLNIIEQRTILNQNGSTWLQKSVSSLKKLHIAPQYIYPTLVEQSLIYQNQNLPVHLWQIPSKNLSMKKNPQDIIIEECMDKDIFTVRPDDIIQLAADMIDWQKIRFILVEDHEGKLAGLISSRSILKALNSHLHHNEELPLSIEDIMVRNPITINSESKLSEALEIMKKYQIGCLPVLQKDKLVGIITEQTYLNVFSNLID